MNKSEFLGALRRQLTQLPESEIQKSMDYYTEIIDDKIEDGSTEEEAITSLGSIPEITKKIMYDTPLPTLIKSRTRAPLGTLGIVLIIVGFPLWFPLALTAIVLFFSFYIVVWSLIITVYTVAASFFIGALALIIYAPFVLSQGVWIALFSLGMGLVMLGLSVFVAIAAFYITRALIKLTAVMARKIKSVFIKKEVNVNA